MVANSGNVWQVDAMAMQPALSVSFDEHGQLVGGCCIFAYDTKDHPPYYLPVADMPQYMRERVALMRLKHGEYQTGIRKELRRSIGVWLGERHLLLALSKQEFVEIRALAREVADADTGSKSKTRSKARAQQVQGVLFLPDDGGLR